MHIPTTANNITGIVESNSHKILIFSPPKSLKRLCSGRIDQLADSNNEPANIRAVRTSLGLAFALPGKSWIRRSLSGIPCGGRPLWGRLSVTPLSQINDADGSSSHLAVSQYITRDCSNFWGKMSQNLERNMWLA